MKNQSRMHTRVTILATVRSWASTAGGGQPEPVACGVSAARWRYPNTKVIHTDDFQRSARLDTYRVIADSGAGRGRKHLLLQVLDVPQPVRQDRSLSQGTFQAFAD